MCKAKSCKYWKTCLVKRDCQDHSCNDYRPDMKKLMDAKKSAEKKGDRYVI